MRALLTVLGLTLLGLTSACTDGSGGAPPGGSPPGTYLDVNGTWLAATVTVDTAWDDVDGDGQADLPPYTDTWQDVETQIEQEGPAVLFFDAVLGVADATGFTFTSKTKYYSVWSDQQPPYYSLTFTGSGDLGGATVVLRYVSYSMEGNRTAGLTATYAWSALQPLDFASQVQEP